MVWTAQQFTTPPFLWLAALNAGKITEGREFISLNSRIFLAQPREKEEVSRFTSSYLHVAASKGIFFIRYSSALPPLYDLTILFSRTGQLIFTIAHATDIHGTRFGEPV